MDPREITQSVAEVIDDVRRRGDEAVVEFTRRWDGVELEAETLRVPDEVLCAGGEDTSQQESAFADAFRRAAERIRSFHARVRPRSTQFEDGEGVVLGLRWTPLRSVGLYVPGGKASYPSTLAMTAIPAQIAGVDRIVVVSPPGPDGEISPQVLLAARVLGLREVYRVGGAQAIAALAVGTATIPRVDKVFGPGNAFVAEAKKQLFGEVGIDLLAGPSEIVVYADETAEPDWVAADLAAQAEHDEDARITLLATRPDVLDSVRESLVRQVRDEPRRDTIEAAIERNGTFAVVGGEEEAGARIDEIAPEHLSIQVRDPWSVLRHVRNAGAIFIGQESPVAIGDYYAGPNHVLPTGTTARFASCLSVEDFMKRSNVVSMNLDFIRRRGCDVEELARGEGLPAHATSVRLRRESESTKHRTKHRTNYRAAAAGRSQDGDLKQPPRARHGVRSVTPYAIVEEDAEVKLNQNESPFDVPVEVKEEVARRLKDLPWNRYHQKLPQSFLERVAEDASFPADGVIAASGSNLILQWIFEAFGGPGRTVVVPGPSFSLYPLWADVAEMRMVTVALGKDLQYDSDAVVERLRDLFPALTILCLPNNPTGSEMEVSAVREIAATAAERGGLVVIDEAYREFSDPRFDRTPLAREFSNVVLVRTCSKAFSAAGMRLGYLLAAPSVATELRKIVPPFHLSLFNAVLGTVLWERKKIFRENISQLVSERDRMMKVAGELPDVEVFPSQANFFLFRVPDAGRVFEVLRDCGILVRKFGGDPLLENCLRVNAGTPEENDRFLEDLKRIL